MQQKCVRLPNVGEINNIKASESRVVTAVNTNRGETLEEEQQSHQPSEQETEKSVLYVRITKIDGST